MAKQETEVAVIGGGAAGIAAARALHDAGVDCLLIEARDRLGGRAFTMKDPRFGHPVDLGCGWLHSADRNPWSTIAADEGFTIDKTMPPWTRPAVQKGFSLDEQRDFSTQMDALYDRMSAMPPHAPDVPVTQMLEPGAHWNPLIRAVGTYISGGDLENVSARDFINYADTEINWRVAEGYGAAIAGHARGVEVSLKTPVTRIDRAGKRLRIETAQGVIEADSVIVTLPSNVIAGMEDLFYPRLPEKTEAARKLPLGLADKLFVTLDNPDEFAPGSRLFGRTDTPKTGAYHLRPFGRPMIECYFGGSNAHELERGGEHAFFEFARDELCGLLGNDFANRIKPLIMHPWASDPFARGSYSYAVPGAVASRVQLAAPVDDRIFFAGEACSTCDFSTAHGGFHTGVAAAEQALKARE